MFFFTETRKTISGTKFIHDYNHKWQQVLLQVLPVTKISSWVYVRKVTTVNSVITCHKWRTAQELLAY